MGGPPLLQGSINMGDGRYLENCHISAADGPILMKFGSLVQK